jgi:uncharacterized protein (TIGR00288 family)
MKMELKETAEDVVVFFDFENIVYSLRHSMGKNPNFEILMDKCQEYGRVVLARAFADWGRHSTVVAPLQASGFDPVFVPTYYYDNQERRTRKNAVDIHIAIEAIEVMFTQPHINTFILLTGDKDFIPLANALRRHGKDVIAIGVKGTTSPYMAQATDDFFFYHQLFDEPNGKRRKPPKKDIYTVLVEAVEKLQREEQKTVFPQVKHTMSEMLGSFDEKDYKDTKGVPFNRFKDFILEAQRLGHVKLVTTGSVNEVLLPGDIVPSAESEEPIPAGDQQLPPPPTEVTDVESGFELLVWAVNHAKLEGKSPRASSIKTIMRGACHGFDEKHLENEEGENFAKFSDFTRAASRRGLVRMKGKGILMEIHPGDRIISESEKPSEPEDDAVVEEEQLDPADDVEAMSEVETLMVDVEATTEEDQEPLIDDAEATLELETPLADDVEAILEEEEPSELQNAPQPTQEPYVSDYRMRVLVIDALRNCEYPAQAYQIGQHCQEMSERRGVPLPNRRLAQLLTLASDMGLLVNTGDQDDLPQEFIYVEDAQLVDRFLEDEAES